MAIRDIPAFAHLTAADIEALGHDLDRIRTDIEKSRGPRDAAYIRRVIAFQRGLETASRLMLLRGGRYRARLAGTVMPAVAEITEDAAETRSERKFLPTAPLAGSRPGRQPVDPITGARRGLRTALAATASKRRKTSRPGRGFQRWIVAFTGARGQQ